MLKFDQVIKCILNARPPLPSRAGLRLLLFLLPPRAVKGWHGACLFSESRRPPGLRGAAH